MSDKLGPLTFGKENELIFLGKELGEERNYSEKTADLIDAEVKKIVESCYEKAKRVIKNQIKVTQLIAETLKDKETLQGEELKKFLDMIKVESEEENPKSIPTNA